MTNLDTTLIPIITSLENWLPSSELAKQYSQFTHSQIKHLLWRRAEDPILNSCCKLIGKRLYVNVPMFCLWMANELPIQKEAQ